MFSLHIDTARTWRGGQNQVLVTVLGLRALGPPHDARRAPRPASCVERAQEGLDLIPLAPKTEMDLSAAWRLSRLIKQLKPDIVHAHDPHGVAMAGLALSMSTQLAKPPLVASRRVDFHLRGSRMSRWKYRQVDCFICASEAIRQMLVADGVPERADGHGARGHRPRAGRGGAAGEAARGAVPAARRTDRRQRRRAGAAQGPAAPHRGGGARRAAGARRALRDRRRRRAAADARAADQASIGSRSTCCSPASGPTSCRCTRRSTSS